MSYDLNFWKYKEGAAHNNQKIYELACCDGETVDILENLPIEEILKKISDAFSDWTKLSDNQYEKEGKGSFEIFATSQAVRFDCYSMQESDMNSLMEILIDFGCPLYDPQISERFDNWTDR